MQVEKLFGNFQLGSSPFWDQDAECLYFVDVTGHTINRYDPKTNEHTSASVERNVSVIIPVQYAKDQFVISLDRKLVLIEWDGVSDEVSKYETLLEIEHRKPENVFNDGKCDPYGRLWIGTMGGIATNIGDIKPQQGTLYCLHNRPVHMMKPYIIHIGYSNGLAFNQSMEKLYHIDSKLGTINEYDYKLRTRKLSNRKVIFTAKKHNLDNVVLDGMTIDTEGHLYIAAWDSKIIKIDPHQPETLLETIELPAKIVSSVTFGGQNLDELYVTTGQIGDSAGPEDGAIYKISGLNTRGCGDTKIVL